MNKEQFMNQLESLLKDIPQDERADALQYYENYFEESGKVEEEVIQALGSPGIVAQKIRENITSCSGTYKVEIEDTINENQSETSNYKNTQQKNNSGIGQEGKWLKIIGIIFLAIFVAPIVIPILASVVIVIVSILFSVVVTLISLILSSYFVGVISIILGILRLFMLPSVGIFFLGIGLIGISVGILCTILFKKLIFYLSKKVVPNLYQGVKKKVITLYQKGRAIL